MSDENKTIRLGLDLDVASFRQAKTVLSELVSEHAKLFQQMNRSSLAAVVGGNALPGSWGGGGMSPRSGVDPQVTRATASGGLGSPMVKGLADQQQALRVIASGSKDAMKAMTDATKAALGEQRKELENYNRSIGELGKRYNELIKQAEEFKSKGLIDAAGASQAMAGGVMARIGMQAQGASSASLNEKLLSDVQSTLEKAIRGDRSDPVKGKGSSGDDDSKSKKMSAYDTTMLVASGVKMASGAVQQGASLAQGYKSLSDSNAAATIQTQTRILGELSRGDLRGLIELQKERAGTGGVFDQYGGTKTHVAGMIASGVGDVTSGAANLAMAAVPGGAAMKAVTGAARMQAAGGVFSSFMGAGRTALNYFTGGAEAAENSSYEQGNALRRALNPLEQLSYDNLQAMAGERVMAAKALQGRGFRAAGIGTGFGLSFGQSTAMAGGLVNAVGIEATFGIGGTAAQKKTGAEALGITPNEAQKQYEFIKATSSAQNAELYRKSLTDEVITKEGTRGSPGLLQQVMQLQKAGFSEGGAAGILTGFANAEHGPNNARGAGAEKRLEEIMARGVARGVTEPKFLEAIASFAAQNAFTGGGATEGSSGLADFLLSGIKNKDAGMHDIEKAITGFKGLDGLMNENPYFNMMKTEAGIETMQSLGIRTSGMKGRGLQRAGLSELLDDSPFMKDLFGNQSADVSKGTTGRFFDKVLATLASSSDTTETPNLMAAIQGKGYKGLAGNDKALTEGALGLTNNFGIPYDAAKSMMDMMAAFGEGKDPSPEARKKLAGIMEGHADGNAESVVRTQMAVIFETLKTEATLGIKDAAKAVKEELLRIAKEGAQDAAKPDFTKGRTYIIEVSKVTEQRPRGGAPPGAG